MSSGALNNQSMQKRGHFPVPALPHRGPLQLVNCWFSWLLFFFNKFISAIFPPALPFLRSNPEVNALFFTCLMINSPVQTNSKGRL